MVQAEAMQTRITDALGIDIPIVQAPMGYIARAQLASAVSNAGGLGIIETSSGRLDEVREEIVKMRDLTDKPWGVNVAHLFVHGVEELVEFVVEHGVKFVTTSAGDPTKLVPMFKSEGITTYHVVPTLRGALKSIAAGVDGLVVEGVEGGGFKNPDGASTMVLVPLIASKVDVPIIAAGGVVDGASMAAAFALGAEGVQMGTRMISAAESPVHDNWKQAIIDAAESDTLVVNRHSRPSMRVLRTERSQEMELTGQGGLPPLDQLMELYFGGDMEAGLAFSGQVAGRIESVRPVADLLEEAWADCQRILADLGERASG